MTKAGCDAEWLRVLFLDSTLASMTQIFVSKLGIGQWVARSLLCAGVVAGASSCTTEIVNHVAAPEAAQGLVSSGSGKVTAAPDTAVINIGVESRGADPKAAVEQNNQHMTSLVATLKGLGIADPDLQTSNFNIHFERNEANLGMAMAAAAGKAVPGAKPEAAATEGVFVVTNTLNVTVRELAKLGDILSASTAAGANTIWGVEFRIDDPEPLLAQARDKAVADAIEKAKRLAAAAGVKLGKLMSVEESGRGGPMPVGAGRYAMAKAVPIEAGSMEVQADVTVRFSIE